MLASFPHVLEISAFILVPFNQYYQQKNLKHSFNYTKEKKYGTMHSQKITLVITHMKSDVFYNT